MERRPPDAAQVFLPRAATSHLVREIERGFLLEVERVHGHAGIATRAKGDPRRTVDGKRKDEAFIVVRVLADEIHASRRAGQERRRLAESALELARDSLPDPSGHERAAR
jgi:N-acetyl-anhydromuramyl-L-alanine amidase AmpD